MAFRYNEYTVIVSIDFGTTFSGTCYAVTGNLTPKELRDSSYVKITHVTDWPQQHRREHKTPSINIYDRNYHLLYWGAVALDRIKKKQLQKGQKVMEKFKLDLPSSVAQKGAIHQTGNTTKKELLNMRATIDYFREIYDHTVSTIQRDFIAVEKDVKIEKENIRFVITVPAQWNDVQRTIMRNVAKEAGLISEEDHENRLLVINESLAATLYCERKKTEYGGLKANDKYMICDAGGGTVDLATFESTEKDDAADVNDSFRRCQITADSGDKCGSVFLDERMQRLLLRIFFNFDETLNKDEKEKKRLEELIAPIMEDFIVNIKPKFGARSKYFKQECNHDNLPDEEVDPAVAELKEEEDDGDDDSDDDSDDDEECPEEVVCKHCPKDDEKYIRKDDYSDAITFRINGGEIEDFFKFNDIDKNATMTVNEDTGVRQISITYKLMQNEVFNKVIVDTLELLKRQIDKANGNIKRTYLVGGFGCSPYLQKRIQERFCTGGQYPKKTYSTGVLIVDTRGHTAAMRGALVYGIDGSRREPQSDVVESKFKSSTEEFNTLVCFDIGYNGTSCSYRDLNGESEMEEITKWPGLSSGEEKFQVPTALDKSDGTRWGAQVTQTTNLDPELLIVPSELMSIVKSDFNSYLIEYLGLLHKYALGIISEKSSGVERKYRYVITMENCYRFFNKKSDMRKIAERAGIISKGDPFERLLLIHRENAAAMYFEDKYFADKKPYSTHFLQINMYHDTCHLALHEATKITGYSVDVDTKEKNTEETKTPYFRNVRTMRSATFNFDFVARLVANLDKFVTKSVCISCNASPTHDTYEPGYYTGLRNGFLKYIKETLDFSNNDTQSITITESGCCIISITVYDLLEHVFRPAIRDLTSEINRFATQVDMAQRFNFDKIFLSGTLVEASTDTYSFLERIITKNISEVMNIVSDMISPSEDNGKEALKGAALYGNSPADFTERVSRKSYAVNVRAYVPKKFDQKVIDEAAKKNKKEAYNLEAMNVLISENEKVDLYYQSAYNPSFKNKTFKRTPEDITFLVQRGDKIFERDQIQGFSKRFYAEHDCIVYATIYSSEYNTRYEDRVDLKEIKKTFQKIHQFEIYVKRDKDDPMTKAPNSRIHFDVRVIPDNNEAKFEANVCSRLGKKIPEFRFRDEILVANIYHDEQHIEVGDLKISARDENEISAASLEIQ